MLTRKVRLRVLAFVVIALLGVGYTGATYAGLDKVLWARGYDVTVKLASTGGIFANAEVTYRGVPVGRVGELRLTEDGIAVPLNIESDAPPIPRDVRAVVANRSAVGEQYVDLRPQNDRGPYLADGAVIEEERTSTPLPVQNLMMNLNSFAESVPKDSLRTVVSELGTAFRGNGRHLQTVLDTTSEFTAEAQRHLPQTKRLIEDSRAVLATQNEQSSAIKSFSGDLRALSAELEESDPDLRGLVQQSPETARQVSGFLDEQDQLGPLLRNLTGTSEVLADHNDGIEQLMTLYPGVVANSNSVVPGDGKAHFGLALNAFDPLPCTAGYEETPKRAGNEMAPLPLNSEAHCAEPPGSETSVRGAQNAP
ncbi:MCE family protein [Salinifilum aidingensis]